MVAPGDAHYVFGVLVDEVLVLVDQRLAHAGGVFLVNAENDRLLEAVTARLKEFRHSRGDQFCALVQDQGAIEVLGVINSVFDFLAVTIDCTLLWPVALDV